MKNLHQCLWLALSVPALASACSSDSDNVGIGANAIGASPAKPAGSPTSAGAATASGSFATPNGFEVGFLGSQSNADGTSTWRYRVSETPCAQDLSNWVLEVFDCEIVGASPEPNEVVNPDPNAKLTGVKWETGGGFTSGEFDVTVSGQARAATIRFAVKGPDVTLGETTGPRCGDAAAPPVAVPPTDRRGNNRCPDASVPPSDAGPSGDAAPIPDAGSDGCTSGISCSEEVPCPDPFGCFGGCCQAAIR